MCAFQLDRRVSRVQYASLYVKSRLKSMKFKELQKKIPEKEEFSGVDEACTENEGLTYSKHKKKP